MGSQKYTPVFLAKEDLDVALGNAYTTRNAEQAKRYNQKADDLRLEFEKAQEEHVHVSSAKAKRQAKERADVALKSSEKARATARKIADAGMPKVR